MKGESKGDFSRDTFNPNKHFLRVLMQQGKVSLDADWNEQVDILLHYMQTLANDIMGPYAGPADNSGFEIKDIDKDKCDFKIGTGRYYVGGILCENEKAGKSCNSVVEDPGFFGGEKNGQQDYPITRGEFSLQNADLPLLVYLDVWERHISYVEDDDIREKALGGPDTASRSKVVWQVKVIEKSDTLCPDQVAMSCEDIRNNSEDIVKKLQPLNRGCLMAQAKKPTGETDPCITSPEARYRGEENQLYRVEIHQAGEAKDATFKWSRDNGSVIFPILDINGNDVLLEHLGRDHRLSLNVGDWVEIIDDVYTLLIQSRPTPLIQSGLSGLRHLAQIDKVDLQDMKVALKLKNGDTLPDYKNIKDGHPFLRRWDYQEHDKIQMRDAGFSGLSIVEGEWLSLEDGVQIFFQNSKPPNEYQIGDYWLIPARTATGDVEWPRNKDGPIPLPPHGIDHHYAPLAFIKSWDDKPEDCRCTIAPLKCQKT